ncbi:benzoate-CoA ligase family protein [Rubrobacter taiwanensis]|jgi:benzoate-CoA ligase family protein|uniref:Benzoate-CoA ligase family protein n=1 Tax=Rubrobacter taiwanensis TaxID=185139 RepID=A0A4R1BCR6_9ACTN|nr:benzoate-CoA ligase family protein [Rubrobacter taiwanensis]TCJ14846.1 benzoate-CoA ligase family protein [Rubrobacter taiwanensis]
MIAVPQWYNASLLVDRNLEAGREGRVAVYCCEEEVTYGELARRINSLGNALRELGVRREQRVLMVLNDTPAFPVTFFAAIRIGAVPIPTNTLLKSDDYRFFLHDSEAVAVVFDPVHEEKVRAALNGHPEEVRLISTGGAEGAHAFGELISSGGEELSPARTHRDDAAFWLYSSGSTGRPKGAVHLQHDILYTCETYARHVLKITGDDRCFSASKLFHAYGLGNNMTFPYWAGASTVLYPGKPAPQAVLETIERYRPTLFYSVPTLYNAILNHPGAAERDLSSVRLCVSAAEALPAGIWRRWKETFGLTILDGIGSTEMLHIFCSNAEDALKPGSSGVPVPGYELEIRDEHGYPVEPGEAGYLYVKGDSAAAYYWRNHEKTKKTMQGEWLAAGDWYRQDEDGFFWYEGRSDDMIKVGGLWVSPVEIESTLGEHPAVVEAAAVGVQVDELTRIKAYVILREGYEGSGELVGELQDWCKERLKRYQYPHIVEFVEDLPRTVTGKIQRFKLRRRSEEEVVRRAEGEVV